jgi:hypothetical protein
MNTKTTTKQRIVIIILAILILFGWAWSMQGLGGEAVARDEVSALEATRDKSLDSLIELFIAIGKVESNFDCNAIGKNGELGAFQLRRIYVTDVNRIIKLNDTPVRRIYKHQDSVNIMDAMYMMYRYSFYYYVKAEKSLDIPIDMEQGEVIARIHNGGPKGYLKESTKAYWLKVKARMERTK